MISLKTPGDWTQTDFERQDAAHGVLKSWALLGALDRNGPAGESLLNAARGMLGSKDALLHFEQDGFDAALTLDDPIALRRFLKRGARVPPRELPAASNLQAYELCWEAGLCLWCVRHEKLACLEELVAMGELERERLDSLPYLKEPQPSPLAQVDDAFLNQHLRPEFKDPDDDGNTLVLALMRSMEQQGLELSLSISTSALARGNPLFALLWRASDGKTPERPMALLERLAFEERLFDPALQTHQSAMLNLVSQGSIGALSLALKAGLSPSDASGSCERDLAGALCKFAQPAGAPQSPWAAMATAFFKPWIDQADPSITDRALRWIERELTSDGDGYHRKLTSLKKFLALWSANERPFGFIDAPSPQSVSRMIGVLSEKSLELKEQPLIDPSANSLKAMGASSRKRQEHQARAQLLDEAMSLLAPLSLGPAAPSLRI